MEVVKGSEEGLLGERRVEGLKAIGKAWGGEDAAAEVEEEETDRSKD